MSHAPTIVGLLPATSRPDRFVSFAVDPSAPAFLRAGLYAFTVLVVAFFAPLARAQQPLASAYPDAASQSGEVLTRGPIHDAFAIPVGLDPVAGLIVPREPPADIEELSPEVAVDDPSAEWISGYWNWDEERSDFIWISGVWRVAPPNHRWVSGYWTPVAAASGAEPSSVAGFQRISGFWAPNETRQVVYYPEPPQSLEAGPNVPQPSPAHFWIPGSWVFADGRYAWRGGYWAASQENWVWIPAYYVRTPGGYVYNAGYWDHPFDDRGMVFAPVYFPQTVYARPGLRFAPSVLIRTTQLLVHLFARPNYGSYYYGDYYGPTYATAGYHPWFSAPRGGNVRWYDPIYTYQRSRHGGDANWSRQWHEQHDYYVSHQEDRPRRTYADQRRYVADQGPNRDRNEFRNAILATSVADVVNNVGNAGIVNNTTINNTNIKNITNVNIRRVQNDERVAIEKRSLEVKQFAKQRSDVERQARVDDRDGRGPGVGPGAAAGQNRVPGVGPGPGNNPRPGGPQVTVGGNRPTLTLPEVRNPTRVDVGFGPREGAGRVPSGGRGPNADRGPGNDPGPGSSFGRGPNANRPDVDNPQTGRPVPMPGSGPNPGSTPNVTPGVPRLPQLPVRPGSGELPRAPRGNMPGGPNVPDRANPALPGATPLPTPKLPDASRDNGPRNLQPRGEQPRNETPRDDRPRFQPPRTDLPKTEQPKVEQPRVEQPRGPRGFAPPSGSPSNRGFNPGGDNPKRANPSGLNPGRGERPPNVGANPIPGASRAEPQPKPEVKQRPQPTERPPQLGRPQQPERRPGGERSQPKNDGPQAGPRGPKLSDMPKRPEGKPTGEEKPRGEKPEKEKKS